MQIDWLCLSFDVLPENLAAAIVGIDVLHFAGALVASPHQASVARLLSHMAAAVELPPRTADHPLAAAAPAEPLANDTSSNPGGEASSDRGSESHAADHPAGEPADTVFGSADTAATASHDAPPASGNRSSGLVDDAGTARDHLPAWCDGLARNGDGSWQGCNFIGQALAELIQQHQTGSHSELAACLFLGDRTAFVEYLAPYHDHLPSPIYYLGATSIRRWTPPGELSREDETAQPPGLPPASKTAGDRNDTSPASDGPVTDPTATTASLALDTSNESAAPTNPPHDPAHQPTLGGQPLLLLQPPIAPPPSGKKAIVKRDAQQSLADGVLEELHPQSLLVQLPAALPGAASRYADIVTKTPIEQFGPIDLEVLRLVIAVQRWTGKRPDREGIVESLEEYLGL